ncbi:16073_t:CDS:2, partial [Dentiscutata heterogama]
HTLDKLADHRKIQVTRSLNDDWEVTSLSAGINNLFSTTITQYYNWEEKRKVYNSVIPIPYELCEDIFLKFAKNIDFKGRYIEMFKEDGGRILDTIIQFYNEEEKKQLDENANHNSSNIYNQNSQQNNLQNEYSQQIVSQNQALITMMQNLSNNTSTIQDTLLAS